MEIHLSNATPREEREKLIKFLRSKGIKVKESEWTRTIILEEK